MPLSKSLPLGALFLAASSLTHITAFTSTTSSPHFGIASQRTSHPTELFARRGKPRGPLRTIEVKPPMNDEIAYDTLRVTVPNLSIEAQATGRKVKDEALGVLSKAEALAKAKELGGLDLVLINETSDPPVAKIVDYSKYRYEKEKKAKELKKNSKSSELKEVKMSYKIDVHDYGVRIKNASKFIKQGNRVKCTVQFRGREMQHDKLGVELLNKMAVDMADICQMDNKPKREGRTLFSILSPKAAVTKAVNDKKRKDGRAKKQKKTESKKARAAGGATVAAVVANTADEDPNPINLQEDDDSNASVDELLGSADAVTNDLFA